MIRSIERRIIAQHRSDEASKRLRSIPGIGIVGATAIAATVPDPKVFRSGRDFAAWIGIVPRQDFDRRQTEARADFEARRPISETHSGGGSPCGVEAGAPPTGEVSVGHTTSQRRPFRVVAVAVANKMARVAWALLARGGSNWAPALAAAA